MYKKAGLIIAIILIVIAAIITFISSCSVDGGIRVSTGGSEAVNSSNSEIIGGNKNTSDGAENSSNSDVVFSSQTSSNSFLEDEEISVIEHNSIVDNTTSVVENNSIVDNTTSVVENNSAESSIIEQDIPMDDTVDKLIEIDENSINYEFIDKEMGGKLSSKKVYLLNDTLVNSFIILAENGETYEYFVPQSAYDSMAIGTKVLISVRIYFDEGVSMVKVLSLKVDN